MAFLKKRIKKGCIILLCIVLIAVATPFAVNGYVKSVGKGRIIDNVAAAELEDVDCILVLGCQVKPGGVPSDMLADRLTKAIELYNAGASDILLMSGDNGTVEYNEVQAMRNYAEREGVPAEDIYTDHAGFSTYESVYRAKEIFGAKKIIIVTQEYHLYRALYIAKQLGVEAYGVTCDYNVYAGQVVRDVREILARNKDFANCIIKPEPTFLGEKIDLV